jgi:hypothetical protein
MFIQQLIHNSYTYKKVQIFALKTGFKRFEIFIFDSKLLMI